MLKEMASVGGDNGDLAKRLLEAGVGVPVYSAPPAVKVKVVRKLDLALLRPEPCTHLGKCPTGRKCGEQIRLCNLLHSQEGLKEGEVRHRDYCQTCADYQVNQSQPPFPPQEPGRA
jgi:hypothetical protein